MSTTVYLKTGYNEDLSNSSLILTCFGDFETPEDAVKDLAMAYLQATKLQRRDPLLPPPASHMYENIRVAVDGTSCQTYSHIDEALEDAGWLHTDVPSTLDNNILLELAEEVLPGIVKNLLFDNGSEQYYSKLEDHIQVFNWVEQSLPLDLAEKDSEE